MTCFVHSTLQDAIVSNGVVPSSRDPISSEKVCGLQKSIKQDDKTVKELPISEVWYHYPYYVSLSHMIL